jgi:hypothetical protein
LDQDAKDMHPIRRFNARLSLLQPVDPRSSGLHCMSFLLFLLGQA